MPDTRELEELREAGMWNEISLYLKQRRDIERAATNAHNAKIDWTWLPERCPDCRLSWALFPPARINDATGRHSGECRCVECKRVYSAALITKSEPS